MTKTKEMIRYRVDEIVSANLSCLPPRGYPPSSPHLIPVSNHKDKPSLFMTLLQFYCSEAFNIFLSLHI
ncbi:Uncharacterized protein HZ326_3416 [Fusarium oxysporum f. sp. albedinis]|nr:Uncharacterized protein HZ326_3416 [Fusarium oxysporum f. sp. albedinis]